MRLELGARQPEDTTAAMLELEPHERADRETRPRAAHRCRRPRRTACRPARGDVLRRRGCAARHRDRRRLRAARDPAREHIRAATPPSRRRSRRAGWRRSYRSGGPQPARTGRPRTAARDRRGRAAATLRCASSSACGEMSTASTWLSGRARAHAMAMHPDPVPRSSTRRTRAGSTHGRNSASISSANGDRGTITRGSTSNSSPANHMRPIRYAAGMRRLIRSAKVASTASRSRASGRVP